jgi:transposase-like protein
MTIVVIEMPLLTPGITCPYCGKTIQEDHVYSVDGCRYRCLSCATVLKDRIEELRANGKVCKEGLQE